MSDKRKTSMLRTVLRATVVLVAAACLAGCAAPPPPPVAVPAPVPPPPAPQATFILLPSADGTTGKIVVSNQGGSRELSRPGEALTISSAVAAPGEPHLLGNDEIEKLVGEALAAQPAAPAHFILYFKADSAELTDASRLLLPAAVSAARERAPADISVAGHTDTLGDATSNFELGLKRARAIAALLGAMGLDQAAMEITSHGEKNPLIPTADNVAEPRNRRVEVTVR